MLSVFRNFTKSKVGIVITLGVLAIIALAFAAGDITGARQGSSSVLGGAVAEVGDVKIGEAELRSRAQTALSAARQQQPAMDMASFVQMGGLTQTLDRIVNTLALQEFGESISMAISKRAVDGEIASIPAFQGFNGKFDQKTYDAVLGQQRLTDRQFRDDIERDMFARQLIAPTIGATQMPAEFATPYASLLLERRKGAVGFIPAGALGLGAPPSDAELHAFYNRQRSRYRVPERRVMRYALVRASDLSAAATPTDAEIAQAYNQQKARFGATEKRSLSQVVVADQAAANTVAAKVKGGTSIADAARAAGLEASVQTGVQKAAFASASAPAVADAAFAAAQGAVVGPIRSPLGFHIVKVDKVEAVPGKTLEQAKPELVAELSKSKLAQVIADRHDKLDDQISDSATFDEVVADNKLKAETTKPLLATGIDPDAPPAPGTRPDPVTALVAQAGFAAEQGDSPQLVQIDADGSFAIVSVGRVIASAAPPLAQIHKQVTADFVIDRNMRAARALAIAAVAKVDKGVPLAQALAETKLKLPPVQPFNLSRAEMQSRGPQQLPPAVALMFSMAPKRAKMLESPNPAGWTVVYLDAIQKGNARGNAMIVQQTRQGLGSVIGREMVEQFTRAVQDHVGVKRNDAAIAKVQGELSGTGGN